MLRAEAPGAGVLAQGWCAHSDLFKIWNKNNANNIMITMYTYILNEDMYAWTDTSDSDTNYWWNDFLQVNSHQEFMNTL